MGCFTDSSNLRTLEDHTVSSSLSTPAYCAAVCGRARYSYSGVEYSRYTSPFISTLSPLAKISFHLKDSVLLRH